MNGATFSTATLRSLFERFEHDFRGLGPDTEEIERFLIWVDENVGTIEHEDATPRAVIVQAAKPGDVVFIESRRKLSIEEMTRIKESFDVAALGVKIVVLPPDLKVATGEKSE